LSWGALEGHSLYLDTNIIIMAVERGYRWTEQLRDLFARIEKCDIRAVTCDLALAEVLAKPLALNAEDLVKTYELLFSVQSALETVPVSRAVLRDSARLQGELGIKLADAIHVAASIRTNCQFFLTNDERLGRKLASPRWLSLPDIFSEKGKFE
jgi:predicted nucleic acid-binding protein